MAAAPTIYTLRKTTWTINMSKRFHYISPPVVDASRWIPQANEEPYLAGYFEYLERARSINLNVSDSNLKRLRLFALAGWCRAVCERGNINHVAECGGFVGHSTYTMSYILNWYRFKNTLHVFDSWEGLSDFEDEDFSPMSDNVTADALRRMSPQFSSSDRRPFASSIELFEEMLSPFNFVKTYPAWIPTKFSEVDDLIFSLVHIDVDVFRPTKDALEFFYPRVCAGGVIWIDDYGLNTWPGCTVAVDEFVKNNCLSDLVLKNPLGGLAIVKI